MLWLKIKVYQGGADFSHFVYAYQTFKMRFFDNWKLTKQPGHNPKPNPEMKLTQKRIQTKPFLSKYTSYLGIFA